MPLSSQTAAALFVTSNLHADLLQVSILALGVTRGVLVVHHALGETDAVNEIANTALGDDVRCGVTDLDHHHGLSAQAALARATREHGQNEDDWVGTPGDDSSPACPLDLILAGLWLSILRGLEADEESVHDVAEWDHREEPEYPASAGDGGNLTRVTVEDHEGREEPELQALGEGLGIGELHDQDNLDEEQRHGEEPVNIAVGIVEGVAGGGVSVGVGVALVGVDNTVEDLTWSVGLDEAVEDTEVVVGGDEGHEAGEAKSSLVALRERLEAEEEEDGGSHHGGESKGGAVVDDVILDRG